MIALLCPTRGRKQQFERMCMSALATSSSSVVYSASNGGDDYCIKHYQIDCPTVFMWNDLAKTALEDKRNKLFMLSADDTIFATPGWDKALLDHYGALNSKIHCYALQDSRDPEGFPHPIVSREWIETLGWFLPPYFLHWKVDTWTNEIAKANKCFTHMKDFLLIHDKPNDRAQPDRTHSRIRQNGWLERDRDVANSCGYLLEYEKQRLSKAMQ